MGFKAKNGGADTFQALRELADSCLETPGEEQFGEQLARLASWCQRFEGAWSHLQLSLLAVRPGDAWLARCAAVCLTDAAPRAFDVSTEKMWIGRRALALSRLPSLMEQVVKMRRVPARALGPLPLLKGVSKSRPNISGSPSDATRGHGARERHQFYRYELELRSIGRREPRFADDCPLDEWYDLAARELEALGQGDLRAIAQRLELLWDPRELDWNRETFVRLMAPLPLRLLHVAQSCDRTALEVQFEKGRLIDGRQLVIARERTDDLEGAPDRVTNPPAPMVRFSAPKADAATIQITYRGERIERERMDILPPLRANVRHAAVRAFENKGELFATGLEQAARPPKQMNPDEFERSIAHLLGILGFSVFWWGPHNSEKKPRRKGEPRDSEKKPGLKVPHDAADLLVCSADDNLVLVVECTIFPDQDPKSARLVRRTERLRAQLNKECGRRPPNVEPVLAVGIDRAQVARILQYPLNGGEVTVLAIDQIERALSRIRKGQPHEEISKELPPAIASGFAALKPFRLWPSDLF